MSPALVPAAIHFPSALQATEKNPAERLTRARPTLPSDALRICTCRSPLPEAMRLPSRLEVANRSSPSEMLGSTLLFLPVCKSHPATVPSALIVRNSASLLNWAFSTFAELALVTECAFPPSQRATQ